MAAGGEIEPHERVARLHQRHERALVGLATGIGLNIGVTAVEKLARARDSELLGDVDELAAAVIALAGISLRVFVGHHRPLRLQDGARDNILQGDELNFVALATELEFDRAGDLRIGGGEGRGEERVRTDRRCGDWGLSGDVHGGGPSIVSRRL